LVIAMLASTPELAFSEKAWVNDDLLITVRAQPTQASERLATLRTGDAVEVLERPKGSDFIRIRTADGIEGWSGAQYLVSKPVAKLRLHTLQRTVDAAQAELAQLHTIKDRLERANTELRSELAQSRRRFAQSESTREATARELADVRSVSANALALRDQKHALEDTLAAQRAEQQKLTEQNRQLASRARRDWFLVGAGVLAFGLLLGLVIGRRQHRRSWI